MQYLIIFLPCSSIHIPGSNGHENTVPAMGSCTGGYFFTRVATNQLQWHLSIMNVIKESNRHFYKIKMFAYGEIEQQRFDNLHPSSNCIFSSVGSKRRALKATLIISNRAAELEAIQRFVTPIQPENTKLLFVILLINSVSIYTVRLSWIYKCFIFSA